MAPDGALSHYPLDSLTFVGGDKPRYGLDELPTLSYTPSVQALVNLRKRSSPRVEGRIRVLTVGNPLFETPKENTGDDRHVARDALLAAFLTGRPISALPATSREVDRVVLAFREGEILRLTGSKATEAAVKAAVE